MDKDTAIEQALENSEWHEQKNKHYCDNCHDKDIETDEVTILPDYPNDVKQIIKFCKVLGHSIEVKDTETTFVISFRISYRDELETFEIIFIHDQLKHRSHTIEYIKIYGKQNTMIVINK